MKRLPARNHYKMSPELKEECIKIYEEIDSIKNTNFDYQIRYKAYLTLKECLCKFMKERQMAIKKAEIEAYSIIEKSGLGKEFFVGQYIAFCSFEQDEEDLLMKMIDLSVDILSQGKDE